AGDRWRLFDDEREGHADPRQDRQGIREEQDDAPGDAATRRHRAHSAKPRPACDDSRPMAVDTPDWVRDAVFYQVFPDRFARSERLQAPGPLEAWDAPPTNHGFTGGALLWIAEHLQ